MHWTIDRVLKLFSKNPWFFDWAQKKTWSILEAYRRDKGKKDLGITGPIFNWQNNRPEHQKRM